MSYQVAPIPMTVNDLFIDTACLRGPCALAELLLD